MYRHIKLLSTVGLMIALFSTQVHADGWLDILKRINEIPPELAKLIVSFGFITGLVFAASGGYFIWKLGRSSMNSYDSMRNPIYSFIASIVLIYMTAFIGVSGVTVFGSGVQDVTIKGDVEINY